MNRPPMGKIYRICPFCDCFIQVNLDGRFRKHFINFKRRKFKNRYCKGRGRIAAPKGESNHDAGA